MLRVPVSKIQPGMILARPVPLPHEPHRFLLQRDVEIPLDLVPRLLRLGIREVWVRCRNLEFLEDVIDAELGERQREVYIQVRRNFERVMHDSSANLDASEFQTSISELFGYLRGNQAGTVLLSKLDSFDNFLMSHSTNVCYLSLVVGLKLQRYLIEERAFRTPRDAKDLQLLGLGCLLQDLGKLRIPPEILNKPGKLTSEEMQIMQLHPVYGYEMVRGQIATPAAQVVLNHHQRWDGNGYPHRLDARTNQQLPALSGRQIPVFCRIATIADVYDAATTKRCYSEAKPPVQVLWEMRSWCANFFDPVVEAAFREVIPPFPIGQVVTLNNGVDAVVVDFSPRSPYRPRVQGLRDPHGQPFTDPSLEELDLALYPELSIVAVEGRDIRKFLPEGETAAPLLSEVLAPTVPVITDQPVSPAAP